jgi:hypothetical protein
MLPNVANVFQQLSLPSIDPSKLPLPSPQYQEQSENLPLSFPLYGELLAYEFDVIKQVRDLMSVFAPRFEKLFGLLGVEQVDQETFDQVLMQLQTGMIEIKTVEEVKVDWDSLGHAELMACFAENDPTTVEGYQAAIPTLNQYVLAIYDAGIRYGNPDELISQIISRANAKITKVEYRKVDAEALLKATGLTWAELSYFSGLVSPVLTPNILICLRLGATSYNPLTYMTVDAAGKMIAAAMGEMKQFDKTPLVVNSAVASESDEADGGSGETVDPLESPTATDTPQSAKPAAKKKPVKND